MRLFGIKYNTKESIKIFQVFQVFPLITLPPAAEHDATTFSKELGDCGSNNRLFKTFNFLKFSVSIRKHNDQ